jgi:O-antigen biosynthesis protein WbqP
MYGVFGKRLLDIILSAVGILFLAPVLLVLTALIKLQDGGPAIFRQGRVGRHEKEFVVMKFRSMPVNAANVPKTQAAAIQITPIGKFIRRTNLDELPQLFNIFIGEMSVVGPRPCLARQEELVKMRRESGVFSCKPGLTGLAQINAYDGMPEGEKVRWEAEYCRAVSLKNDILIILKTFLYLRKPPPVY